jgi:hypothetical protein
MAVTGTVRSADGAPIQGVLVMGADLNYSETDANGCFTLARPELALFFWCTGFLPEARALVTGESRVEVVMRRAASMAMRAGGR